MNMGGVPGFRWGFITFGGEHPHIDKYINPGSTSVSKGRRLRWRCAMRAGGAAGRGRVPETGSARWRAREQRPVREAGGRAGGRVGGWVAGGWVGSRKVFLAPLLAGAIGTECGNEPRLWCP